MPTTRLVSPLLAAALAIGALSLGACATPEPLIESVGSLEVERYMGRWYDVASYPQQFRYVLGESIPSPL